MQAARAENQDIENQDIVREAAFRALIVEDSRTDQRLIREALSDALEHPFECETSERLDLALKKFRWADFDLIFLDLNLPDASWLDTLQSIRRHGNEAPIIVMTGLNDEDVGRQAIRAGAQDYLVKGEYDDDTLRDILNHAVERHRLLLELKTAREREWRQANIDSLTQLPNRRSFEEDLDQAIIRAHRTTGMFALLLVELDYAAAGTVVTDDDLLLAAALRLRDLVRGSDVVARIDERSFAVLLHDLREAGSTALVAEKIVARLSESYALPGGEIGLSVNVGISLYPLDSGQSVELLQFADLAMYRVKDEGGDAYHFYSEQLEREISQRLSLENNLRQAISAGELRLHYQPSVDLGNGAVVTMEALLRWQHNRHGLLPPHAFVPMAEDGNLIMELDYWALEQACRQNLRWQQAGHFVRVAVNISARHFRRPERLVAQVKAVLDSTGLDAEWLELEVTETALIQQLEQAAQALRELRELGVHITIDDFGVGYSSLSYLRDLPVDTVKIDRSFLTQIPADSKNATLFSAILALATTLSLRVVAEGVEKPEQARWLRELDCHSAQGYFFAYPDSSPSFDANPGFTSMSPKVSTNVH